MIAISGKEKNTEQFKHFECECKFNLEIYIPNWNFKTQEQLKLLY